MTGASEARMSLVETRVVQCVSPDLVAAGDAVAAWVAETLQAAGPTADGLYVASPDAGAREAIAFWLSAQETGYTFAAPAAFPWTLANSPTGRISAALSITGPCHTYVGGEEAVAEAFLTAREDVADGVVTRALVVSIAGNRPVAAAGDSVSIAIDATVLVSA